jgi:hypothetical protein
MASVEFRHPPTARELAREVREMRRLQKAFFKGERHLFDDAKRQEKRVDAMCEDVLVGQGGLDFGGSDA